MAGSRGFHKFKGDGIFRLTPLEELGLEPTVQPALGRGRNCDSFQKTPSLILWTSSLRPRYALVVRGHDMIESPASPVNPLRPGIGGVHGNGNDQGNWGGHWMLVVTRTAALTATAEQRVVLLERKDWGKIGELALGLAVGSGFWGILPYGPRVRDLMFPWG